MDSNVWQSKLIILLMFLVLFQMSGLAQQNLNEKPNILFIAIDDLNDWISPLAGKSEIKTPNFERLASSAITFVNAHTASPACAPSRTAIMTGILPVHSGIMQNTWYDGPEWRSNKALKDIEVLPQFFKDRGYKTLGAGKLYHTLSPPWKTISQIEPENWDYYYPSKAINIPYQIRAPEDVINPEYFIGNRHPWFTWGVIPATEEKMSDHQVVDWVSYELSRPQEKPFFMGVGLFRPHMPWEVPQKYFDMYPLEEISLPVTKEDDLLDALDHGRRGWHKFVVDNNQWKKVVQSYMATISFADEQLGRLLTALERSPFAENTIVVLWSDHGMHIGEKQNWEKFTLWEESTRVPLMIMIPGMSTAGQKCYQPVSLLDIYPTLVEATGFQLPPHLDGISLVKQIENPKAVHKPVITSYRYKMKVEGKRLVGHSIRSLRYRYIYYPGLGLEELYDHTNDPNEYHNIAYMEGQKSILQTHRSCLLDVIPNLTWGTSVPKGYRIENDKIENTNYIPLSEVNY